MRRPTAVFSPPFRPGAPRRCPASSPRPLAARLGRQGGKVILTRPGDTSVPLSGRTSLANASGADLFISIHLNSMPTAAARRTAHGTETYFLSADASDAAANAVADRE